MENFSAVITDTLATLREIILSGMYEKGETGSFGLYSSREAEEATKLVSELLVKESVQDLLASSPEHKQKLFQLGQRLSGMYDASEVPASLREDLTSLLGQ